MPVPHGVLVIGLALCGYGISAAQTEQTVSSNQSKVQVTPTYHVVIQKQLQVTLENEPGALWRDVAWFAYDNPYAAVAEYQQYVITPPNETIILRAVLVAN